MAPHTMTLAVRCLLLLIFIGSICCSAFHSSALFQTARTQAALQSRRCQIAAFIAPEAQPRAMESQRISKGAIWLSASKEDSSSENSSNENENDNTMNPLTKASWYAAEALGKIFAPGENAKKSTPTSAGESIDFSQPPKSLDEALQRIQLDNDRSYFLSGEVDVEAYDPDCVFSDPFVSFAGRDRFVENLANLGSFITKYDAKMLGYDVENDGLRVKTKVMVKLELNLPWKPVLAWPWGVTYDIDPQTLLVTNHAEAWDIEAWEGVKQVFRKPTVTIK